MKEVHLQSDESSLVEYSAKANFKVLGKSLGKDMKEVASMIADFDGEKIASILDGTPHTLSYSNGEISISKDEIIVQRTEMEGVKVLNDGSLTVGFDTKVTQELADEGIARDIIRSVQNLRKESGFAVSDRIVLTYDGDEVIQRVFDQHGQTIAKETLSNTLRSGTLTGEGIDCNDHMVRLQVEKD